jgi:hypothetical protein
MDTEESLNHSVWECKYHVVFIPKCRRKVLYSHLLGPLAALTHVQLSVPVLGAWLLCLYSGVSRTTRAARLAPTPTGPSAASRAVGERERR